MIDGRFLRSRRKIQPSTRSEVLSCAPFSFSPSSRFVSTFAHSQPYAGIICLLFGAFLLVAGNIYGFSLHQVGLSFLGILVVRVAASRLDPVWHCIRSNLIHELSSESGVQGSSQLEFRWPPAIVGALIVPVGVFMFGWSCYSWVHRIMPSIESDILRSGQAKPTHHFITL